MFIHDDEEMVMLAKKFKRTFKYDGSKYKIFLKTPKTKEELVCYKCNKWKHIKPNCSKHKDEKPKGENCKKAVAAWRDNEQTSSNGGEVANLCMMAFDNDNIKFSQRKKLTMG